MPINQRLYATGMQSTQAPMRLVVIGLWLALFMTGCHPPEQVMEPATPKDTTTQPAALQITEQATPTTQDMENDIGPTAPFEDVLARLEQRPDWTDRPDYTQLDVPRHPAERFLQGMIIVLDPGHGGDAHLKNYKRGPTGVREAEINLRVALLLRKLLADAGVTVVMTREGDVDVSLEERARIANSVPRPDGAQGADLFLSLHHNAAESTTTNYTSVWHHAEVDGSEVALDVARHLALHIAAALRTEVGRVSPVLSDQLIYKNGFGVLRRCEVPAVLLESSFHSNPEEEQRLRDPHYNLAEAYAIYRGLCEYAWLGRPTQSTPVVQVEGDWLAITSRVNDGLPTGWWGGARQRTLTSSIHVKFGDAVAPWSYDAKTRTLTAKVKLAEVVQGTASDEASSEQKEIRQILRVHHANQFKQHNWPQRYEVVLMHKDGAWQVGEVKALGPMRVQPEIAPTPPVPVLPNNTQGRWPENRTQSLPATTMNNQTTPRARSATVPRQPWAELPQGTLPVRLQAARAGIDELIDLPPGSMLTLARVTPQGQLITARWRNTGSMGFYPASTVKWVTAFMALDWMDRHQLTLDHVIQVGDDPPASLRGLLSAMIVVSDNDAFNTLQEAVGFAETYEAMQRWGCEKSMVRRHFTRPRYNSSRAVQLISPLGETIKTIPGRPPAEIPLNDDDRPAPVGNREANWFTSDDLVRMVAATLMGPMRERTYFAEVTQWLSATDQCFARDGLVRLTGRLAGSPGFVVLNKPGWWPGDGANVDALYIYDVQRDEHYLLGVYVQGTEEDAKKYMSEAAEKLFTAIHEGRLRLE